ncbi:MAG: hypothetical protein ACPGUU_01760 [Flavobacteriaceae bacterium]
MKGNLSKILTIVIAAVGVIGAVLFIRVMSAGEDQEALSNSVGSIVMFSQILLYVAIGVTIVLSLWSMLKNPAALKKALLGIGVLAVLLVISYFLGDSNAVTDAQDNVLLYGEAGASSNKWTSTGIWYSLILGAIGTVFFVSDLVKGLIK